MIPESYAKRAVDKQWAKAESGFQTPAQTQGNTTKGLMSFNLPTVRSLGGNLGGVHKFFTDANNKAYDEINSLSDYISGKAGEFTSGFNQAAGIQQPQASPSVQKNPVRENPVQKKLERTSEFGLMQPSRSDAEYANFIEEFKSRYRPPPQDDRVGMGDFDIQRLMQAAARTPTGSMGVVDYANTKRQSRIAKALLELVATGRDQDLNRAQSESQHKNRFTRNEVSDYDRRTRNQRLDAENRYQFDANRYDRQQKTAGLADYYAGKGRREEQSQFMDLIKGLYSMQPEGQEREFNSFLKALSQDPRGLALSKSLMGLLSGKNSYDKHSAIRQSAEDSWFDSSANFNGLGGSPVSVKDADGSSQTFYSDGNMYLSPEEMRGARDETDLQRMLQLKYQQR